MRKIYWGNKRGASGQITIGATVVHIYLKNFGSSGPGEGVFSLLGIAEQSQGERTKSSAGFWWWGTWLRTRLEPRSTVDPDQHKMPPKGGKRKSNVATPVQADSPQPPSLVESLSYAHYPRPFKNPNYTKNANRRAKSAKQVIGAEREREKLGREKLKAQGMDVDWTEDPEAISFTSIEAPPSVLPQKRYCDITGLEAPYTDPASGLRYHDKSIYELIKSLNPASMQAYRSVRNPHSVVK